MAPVATGSVPPVDRISAPSSKQSIEEVCFSAALVCLEGHYNSSPPMPGPLTQAKVTKMVQKTLEKSQTLKPVREALSTNVEIWVYLTKIFAAAIPTLNARSVGMACDYSDADRTMSSVDSSSLIIKNYVVLKEDLLMLNRLMLIARNLLVHPEPEVPQDICAAVSFDQMVCQTIILCVNVTSKAYDGDILDDACRNKLADINELYKKLLVTSLQQAHNWTAKNDRNKMSFWSDVLFDDDSTADDQAAAAQGSGFRPEVCRIEVWHYLERNPHMCPKTRQLLTEYVSTHASKSPGIPAPLSPMSANWIPDCMTRADDPDENGPAEPRWDVEETDKFKQDKAWGRVSHEIDSWWDRARDENFDGWNVAMPSKEVARARQESFVGHIENRYAASYPPEEDDGGGETRTAKLPEEERRSDQTDNGSRGMVQDYVDDLIEDDDLDDNESYVDGPMSGLLTEIPNILDPKQIEALHMIVKSCILDSMGSGLTRYGENLQKTRCRMFLALECGRSLLREILVFIAVWEKDEASLIFEITTNIVEALHDVALLPYAWNSLRIPKDVISPAQAVLLRLINHMLRKRYISSSPPPVISDGSLDIKLIHYLFTCVRSRIVPECLAFMRLQGDVRRKVADPADFPVDNWDMERARDGLAQALDFLFTISEIDDMRRRLVDWDATFELISLLKGLEDGVARKSLVDPIRSSETQASRAPVSSATPVERPYDDDDLDQPPPPPPPPPPQDPGYNFPWAGIKIQILAILAHLLQPARGMKGPGNATVQAQIMQEKGIVPLLNCTAYDDHNRFASERVQVCLRFLMDGSEEARRFLQQLVKAPAAPFPPTTLPPPTSAPASTTSSLRIDGVDGDVKVQFRSAPVVHGPAPPPPPAGPARQGSSARSDSASAIAAIPSLFARLGQTPPPGSEALAQASGSINLNDPRIKALYDDILTLANEAAQITLSLPKGQELDENDFM